MDSRLVTLLLLLTSPFFLYGLRKGLESRRAIRLEQATEEFQLKNAVIFEGMLELEQYMERVLLPHILSSEEGQLPYDSEAMQGIMSVRRRFAEQLRSVADPANRWIGERYLEETLAVVEAPSAGMSDAKRYWMLQRALGARQVIIRELSVPDSPS